jgi:hypothetical protein
MVIPGIIKDVMQAIEANKYAISTFDKMLKMESNMLNIPPKIDMLCLEIPPITKTVKPLIKGKKIMDNGKDKKVEANVKIPYIIANPVNPKK